MDKAMPITAGVAILILTASARGAKMRNYV